MKTALRIISELRICADEDVLKMKQDIEVETVKQEVTFIQMLILDAE